MLDPFLEQLVTPVVERFKQAIANVSSSTAVQRPESIAQLGLLLYYYVKFRGYKTISETALIK